VCDARDCSSQVTDRARALRARVEGSHHYLAAGHRYHPIIADHNQMTVQLPVKRGTIQVRLVTAHAHSAYAQKRSCTYRTARHRYQSIIADLNPDTDRLFVKCGANPFRLLSGHTHSAHARKRSCLYLTAGHRYQLISSDLSFNHRCNACNARDYSCQISDRACAQCACAEEIMYLFVRQA
jgi:hypothetical protein